MGISALGIHNPETIYNLSYPELFEHEKRNNGVVVKAEYGDTFAVDTKFTGAVAGDKWVVKNEGSESDKTGGERTSPPRRSLTT